MDMQDMGEDNGKNKPPHLVITKGRRGIKLFRVKYNRLQKVENVRPI